MVDEIDWMGPWWHLDANAKVKAGIQKELEFEIGPNHPLWELRPIAIAKIDANDDVIVQLNDGRLACVHLTWHGKIDQHPEKYPTCIVFRSVESLQTYINEEADEYT